jgi:hypothetical protein
MSRKPAQSGTDIPCAGGTVRPRRLRLEQHLHHSERDGDPELSHAGAAWLATKVEAAEFFLSGGHR